MTPNEWLLNQLMQECNEVAHRVSKILQFGVDDKQPGQSLTNGERVRGEMVDLLTTYALVIEAGLLEDHPSEKEFDDAALAKRAQLLKWLKYSQEQGVTSPGMPGVSPVPKLSS